MSPDPDTSLRAAGPGEQRRHTCEAAGPPRSFPIHSSAHPQPQNTCGAAPLPPHPSIPQPLAPPASALLPSAHPAPRRFPSRRPSGRAPPQPRPRGPSHLHGALGPQVGPQHILQPAGRADVDGQRRLGTGHLGLGVERLHRHDCAPLWAAPGGAPRPRLPPAPSRTLRARPLAPRHGVAFLLARMPVTHTKSSRR